MEPSQWNMSCIECRPASANLPRDRPEILGKVDDRWMTSLWAVWKSGSDAAFQRIPGLANICPNSQPIAGNRVAMIDNPGEVEGISSIG